MFRRWLPTEAAAARATLFLLSDESRWTTAAILPCEGGRAAA